MKVHVNYQPYWKIKKLVEKIVTSSKLYVAAKLQTFDPIIDRKCAELLNYQQLDEVSIRPSSKLLWAKLILKTNEMGLNERAEFVHSMPVSEIDISKPYLPNYLNLVNH
jgi:hypothetical protein